MGNGSSRGIGCPNVTAGGRYFGTAGGRYFGGSSVIFNAGSIGIATTVDGAGNPIKGSTLTTVRQPHRNNRQIINFFMLVLGTINLADGVTSKANG